MNELKSNILQQGFLSYTETDFSEDCNNALCAALYCATQEIPPMTYDGKSYIPLISLDLSKEKKGIPQVLHKFKYIVVWMKPYCDLSQNTLTGCFVVRAYTDNVVLQRCLYGSLDYTPVTLVPEYMDSMKNNCCNRGVAEFGSLPSIVDDSLLGEFECVFTVASSGKAKLNIGNDGRLYFCYNPEKNVWKVANKIK